MARARLVLTVSIVLVSLHLGGATAGAQAVSRYRDYTLGTGVAAVVTTSGLREADTRTLHLRPARIQQLEWRLPYVSGSIAADPVQSVLFSFVDDQLYQIQVTYDRERMDGLTNADVIQSIAAEYGQPIALPLRPARGTAVTLDTTVLARWEDANALVTLTRGTDAPRFQLVLVSKVLAAKARLAIAESARLDAMDAPQREADQRMKDAAAAALRGEKARAANKAGFRP